MAQKWYQKSSVQTALVSGAFLLIGISIPYLFKVPKLQDQIATLEKDNKDKTAEVQRLETLLAPFRTIALDRYTGPEKEALNKLAVQIQLLQERDEDKTNTINKLKAELAQTAQDAKPPFLALISHEVVKGNNGLTCTLRFQPSKNQPLGGLQFIAQLPDKSDVNIINFSPTLAGGAYLTGDNWKYITEDKKLARITYSLMGVGHPTIELMLSEPTVVRISGNFLPEPIKVDIK